MDELFDDELLDDLVDGEGNELLDDLVDSHGNELLDDQWTVKLMSS